METFLKKLDEFANNKINKILSPYPGLLLGYFCGNLFSLLVSIAITVYYINYSNINWFILTLLLLIVYSDVLYTYKSGRELYKHEKSKEK